MHFARISLSHRYIAPWLTLLVLGAGLTANAQMLRVVNAASLASGPVAPGSIVSIFGSGLASDTAAVSDPLHPPQTLGGVTVTIGGAPATLFYVSPAQINAVVSASAAAGTQPVTVQSPKGSVSGSVVIDPNSPPGLFSLTGTGTRDGAIINALTYQVGAVSTTTGNKPTFLSLFATGANFATSPIVTIGGVPATVTFAGSAPCCAGLQQINLTFPDSLAGSGRVPVMIQAAGQLSNVVEIVLLPKPGQGAFADTRENTTRSRELSALAYIPGTSLALSTDENDDVVRVIDVAGKKVSRVISLPSDAEPAAVAVNSAATLALVAERNQSKVALINLTTFMVDSQIPVGGGPVSIAISGNLAVVVNGDADSATIIDIAAKSVLATVPVGRGPRGVAIGASNIAYVTNQGAGTISVIDLGTKTVTKTINLGSARPAAIQIVAGTSFAVVADPATSPNGKILLVDLSAGTVVSVDANPDRSGGSSDIALTGNFAYIANQSGGSISVLPLTIAGGVISGSPTSVSVGLGVRALAIDTKDNLLLATNQGSGTIVLVSLASTQVVGRIDAVRSSDGGDDGEDDHSDRNNAKNLPTIQSLTPVTAKVNTTFTITVNGTNLAGATDVLFVKPAMNPGDDHGHGKGNSGDHENGPLGMSDSAFKASNINVNSAGTQLTATINVAASATDGVRVVRVMTPNGETGFVQTSNDTITVSH